MIESSHAASDYLPHAHPKLLRVAKAKLKSACLRSLDEEDIAQSSFKDFFIAAKEEKFPELKRRGNLWALLLTIVSHKAVNKLKRKRLRGDSAFLGREGSRGVPLAAPDTRFSSSEMEAATSDEFERLLGLLGDDELRLIAVLKFEELRNKDIAKTIGRSESTVERRLQVIRAAWKDELDDK